MQSGNYCHRRATLLQVRNIQLQMPAVFPGFVMPVWYKVLLKCVSEQTVLESC